MADPRSRADDSSLIKRTGERRHAIRLLTPSTRTKRTAIQGPDRSPTVARYPPKAAGTAVHGHAKTAGDLDEGGPAVRASVCMATYDGERFLGAQLDSVLEQLEPDDELVIVDDASRDTTPRLLDDLTDSRIRVFRRGHNLGYVRTFEEAMTRATGDVLLLSDQDDVWLPGHRAELVAAATAHGVAASNLALLDRPGFPGPYGQQDWVLRAADSTRHWRNIGSVLAGNRPYYGCAMAVHRPLLDLVLPFPAWLYESHDLWIAVCANVAGQMAHVEHRTVARRLHDANSSSPRPRGPREVLRSRLLVARMTAEATRRVHLRRASTAPAGR